MRVTTDDGRFGFIVAASAGKGMFLFQMVIDGQIIGDADPCFLGSAMATLRHLPDLADNRLADVLDDRDRVWNLFRSDEELHDHGSFNVAESLDSWSVSLYRHNGRAVALARAYEGRRTLVGPVLVAEADENHFQVVIDAVIRYWTEVTGLRASNYDAALDGGPP